jgi:mono/diheme cytochrome c family protein
MVNARRNGKLAALLVTAIFAQLGIVASRVNDSSASAQDAPSPRPATTNGQSPDPAQPSSKNSSSPSPALSATAIQVYRASCVECHDLDGRGEFTRENLPAIPDFTDGKWQLSRSDAQLSHSILEGKGKSMPRMKKKLGAVDVTLMVALVRAFRDGKLKLEDEPDAPASSEKPAEAATTDGSARASSPVALGSNDKSAQQGSRLFQRSCSLCHGRDGKGAIARDSLPTIPDFTVRTWQQKRTNAQLRVSILDGKGTGMPAFRGKLPPDQARELVAYIRTFAPGAAAVTASSTYEFEQRFNALAREFDELARQIAALSKPESTKATNPPQSDPAAKKK